MSDAHAFILRTDGGSRGNPGPAAFAFIIERPGSSVVEDFGYLGETTNNIAEYTALIRGLEKAAELGGKKVQVLSDSELMVQQMRGNYKVRNEGLIPLFEEARELCKEFTHVDFVHVRRELNKRADALCNRALDEASGSPASKPASKSKKPAGKHKADDTRVRAQALECLMAAAGAWRMGQNLDVAAVWDQLWSILEEEKVV